MFGVMARFRSARANDEVGAVAVIVGAISLVLVIIAAFAVDIGMQRVARRDMQSLADVVALDLSRDLTGDQFGTYNLTSLKAAADASAARNGDTLGDKPEVVPVLGMVDFVTGDFSQATKAADVPNAVRVDASTSIDFSFVGGSGGAARSAIATAEEDACIKIGSSALDLNSGNSALLGPILGDALDVTAIGYQGLVGTKVTLGDLAVALNAGTTDELLATQVTAADFFAAIVTAVNNDADGSNDGVANVLNAQLLSTLGANLALERVTVGQLISVGQGDNAALASQVNIFDLVTGAAFVANGDNALAIPGLNVAPLGITASLFLIEPPRQACRKGVAQTSQIRVVLKQQLPVLGLLGINLATVNLEVELNLANASGGVGNVTCTDGEASQIVVRLDQSTLATLTTKLDVKLLGLPITSALLPTSVPASSPAGSYTLDLPRYYETQPDAPFKVPAGTTPLGTPPTTAAQLSLLGINLGVVAGLVTTVVNPALVVLTNVLNATIVPLLGLRLGGADIFVQEFAECGNPALRG